MRVLIAENRVLNIGKTGENDDLQIRFPIADWVSPGYPGTFQLLHRRSKDAFARPVAVTADDQYVYWLVSESDVAYVGEGACELHYNAPGIIGKSQTWVTEVYPSESPDGDEPEEPFKSWVDDVLAVASEVKQSAEQAESSAESAKEFAESAKEFAESAKEFAESAEKSAEVAQGAVNKMSYVNFEFDDNGDLIIVNSERLVGTNFSLNDDGDLEVEING